MPCPSSKSMLSPGAKSLRGWLRFTARFLRCYCCGLAAGALLLLGTALFWPDSAPGRLLAALIHPDAAATP